MPIFQDQTGLAIKFFIQKDLPQDIQAEVCETIAALGGRVESKVPRAGYVLVQPGTAEEERLRLCWNQPDRPERFFVPYTYVNACKIHGMLLKQIFVHEGQPIRMHIDSSIANINVRAALSARIMHSGGDPTASAQSARVILADPNTEVFQHLVKTYQGEADKYVESYLWVKKCIEKGQVIYTPVIYKNPGGRRPGEERTQFSEEDEVNLCHWIAAKIPYKETGGRTGNRLYQQLCEMSTDPEYAWVTRHTWQSWRERYKKNSARLDKLITEIVGQRKPAHGEKGQYGYVRVPEERPKRIRSRRAPRPEGEIVEAPVIRTEQEEREHLEQQQRQEQQELQELENFAAIPMPSGVGVMQAVGGPAGLNGVPVNGVNVIMYPGPPSAFPPQVNGAPINPAEARQIATEEEMEDEEGEWQVREGDPEAPQPAWAKRKQGETEAGPNKKRQRPSQSPEHSEASETSEMHVVDRAVHEIARQFRFTVEEVKEYYDKCGDAERTRARFQKMREALAALDDDLPPVNMS
ncbi:hypothetical protein WOLCODRAFT_86832 [Wolfiporia cocos MD-104 SS10]|uniref:DNA-binding protein RAP1 n=1 Tax=Wolfiporia cocos (strain MD-104) TaxID=742152 RepID=A0A2H3JC63_WOLCO|nr:hypothetical protein WOLCODRAFT_86832 [Wolfiporia cocos MD-104 SS10]